MSRTERLLSLIQFMRRHRRPVPGRLIAAELGISMRTLYRDIATLQGQGASIEGEAGLGYVLSEGFMLPPLMLTAEETEALVLGARCGGLSAPSTGSRSTTAMAKAACRRASSGHLRWAISRQAGYSSPGARSGRISAISAPSGSRGYPIPAIAIRVAGRRC